MTKRFDPATLENEKGMAHAARQFVKGELSADDQECLLAHIEKTKDILWLMEIDHARRKEKIPVEKVPGNNRLRMIFND